MRFEMVLNCDHFQFYLQDANSQEDTSTIWDLPSVDERISVTSDMIAVQTARYGGKINVIIDIREERPTDPLDQWDLVIECSINLLSGELAVLCPENDDEEIIRIPIRPNLYRALVCYGGLETVIDEMAQQGDDVYQIILWPDKFVPPRLVKSDPQSS